MTVRRFERIVEQSRFRFAEFEARPIRRLRRVANRWTREFTTAVVHCKLVPKSAVQRGPHGPRRIGHGKGARTRPPAAAASERK